MKIFQNKNRCYITIHENMIRDGYEFQPDGSWKSPIETFCDLYNSGGYIPKLADTNKEHTSNIISILSKHLSYYYSEMLAKEIMEYVNKNFK